METGELRRQPSRQGYLSTDVALEGTKRSSSLQAEWYLKTHVLAADSPATCTEHVENLSRLSCACDPRVKRCRQENPKSILHLHSKFKAVLDCIGTYLTIKNGHGNPHLLSQKSEAGGSFELQAAWSLS